VTAERIGSHKHTHSNGDPLFDIFFIYEERGLAIGAYGLALSTNDGGKRWLRENITDGDFHLYTIASAFEVGKKNQFYIVGESGTLLKSRNLDLWNSLDSPYGGTLFTLTANKNHITATGLRGNIIQSIDNGLSWNKLSSSTVAPFQGSTILTNGKILFAGPGGSLFASDVSGNNFNRVLFPINYTISQVLQISNTDLLLSGDFGLRKSPINITLMTVTGNESHD